MWFVYILQCQNDRLYTGITNDAQRRLKEHQAGKGGYFTRAFGAKDFVYKEKTATRSSALKREAEIKKMSRKQKLELIKS